ncbi:CNT family concentrative nucleoside transporter [Jezberella montanilacus]|jgi:CNT family concentrative nucleoside transporter|uniref:CNT family concentrative nucleoside transporter n=1 Tax=Jezberella montanilacus TaxID=323426 RepID=A0A2T0XEA2_9BURK|nr:nucleoside transporter C-terminal domain-containing protein [Jezberella montanilacus]PRY97252.1 CNT family concentrative nucleoside transporter [Jezberella montanilacus]|eukprot:gene3977-4027_t
MSELARAVFGYATLMGLAWLISENRKAIPWRTVIGGVVLQTILTVMFFKISFLKTTIAGLNDVMQGLLMATKSGTSAVFGYLGGAPSPFASSGSGSSFILAFQALPIVLLMSVISALLFHWGVLPRLVKLFSVLLEKIMNVSGSVGLSTAANVFLGMVEAPLLIKPYLDKLSRGELFAVMSVGMSGVAGSVMALYAGILSEQVPDALGHILIASFVSAPAALAFSALMVPSEKGSSELPVNIQQVDTNSFDAIVRATSEGLQTILQIGATLIVFISLVTLVNELLSWLTVEEHPVTLQGILGYLMAPLAWLIGIPWDESVMAGSLLGTKTVLNELVAYIDMANLPSGALSAKSQLILTYAMCGFANLGSLGILIGGMTAMTPVHRKNILDLGLRTIVAGTLATLSCGCIVSYLIH